MDLLTLIAIDVDEEIFFVKLFSEVLHVLLDRLARTAPFGGNLAERFLRSSANDVLTEFINVLRINKGHVPDEFGVLIKIFS